MTTRKPTPAPKPKPGPQMTRAELIAAAKHTTRNPLPLRKSPALKVCIDAFWYQIEAELERGANNSETLKAGAKAYKLHMPEMCNLTGVRDYIDAVANGVCLGAFDGKEASSLLYAAQVALSTIHRMPARARV